MQIVWGRGGEPFVSRTIFSPEREIKKTSEGRFEKEEKKRKHALEFFFLSRGDREQISGEDAKEGGLSRGGG